MNDARTVDDDRRGFRFYWVIFLSPTILLRLHSYMFIKGF